MWRVPLFVILVQFPAQLWAADNAADAVQFETHVRPILKAHCWHCHGEADELKGSLDARLARTLLQGGDSGPAIEPGDHAHSLLYQRVVAGEMPPSEKKLTPAQIDVLARWIDQGARTAHEEPASLPPGNTFSDEERNHWSFQPIRRPPLPEVRSPELVHSPIDAFLLAALEAKGLSFGPPADRPTLIRRLYFDLTGLPPSPSAVERFVNDSSPDAYERIVDELLASPGYGEHWGRHWLDVVGYADSDGYSGMDSPRKWAYRYRDYVIRALNNDKPWNEFLVEQLSGDELLTPPLANLTPEQADRLIATGMLRMGPDGTSDGAVDQNLARNDVIANTIKIVSSAVLGLTVGCAQCHDHRYDPISQADYYRMRAIFEPAYDWKNWRSPNARLVSLWTNETRKKADAVTAKLQEITTERNAELDKIVSETFERELAKLPAEAQSAARAAHDTPADKRSDAQKDLIKRHPFLNVDRGTVYLYLPDRLDGFNKKWEERTAKTQKEMPADDFVQCLTEIPGQIPTTKLFARGDFNSPKQDIAPAELTVLNTGGFTIASDDPQLADQRSTTRLRSAPDRWPSSAGRPRARQSLLDASLRSRPGGHAGEFRRAWRTAVASGVARLAGRRLHGRRLEAQAPATHDRHLNRLSAIVAASAELDAVDPENRLLGRMSDPAARGRNAPRCAPGHVRPLVRQDVRPAGAGHAGRRRADRRRSRHARFRRPADGQGRGPGRGRIPPQHLRAGAALEAAGHVGDIRRARDVAQLRAACQLDHTPRSRLLLMNNTFVLQQAEAMAQRIEKEVGGDPAAQFQRAWQLAYCRSRPRASRGPAWRSSANNLRIIAASAASQAKSGAAQDRRTSHCRICARPCVISNGFLYVE